jgi:3-oxoacyl-[acyl-carrier protein] reductase
MNKSQILERKRAVVFGAGGSIGAAVAKEFAAEGAEVFLAGRTQANVEGVVKQIMADGGCAHAAVTDAVDDVAVDGYIDGVARQTGRIDILFNAIGPLATEYGNGKNAVDLTVEEYMVPLTIVKSQFITARAAARQMVKQRSGAIIFLTGSPARGHVEGATAIGAAFGAIESFMENLAVEIGPVGVRAVCLRTTANTDSRTI